MPTNIQLSLSLPSALRVGLFVFIVICVLLTGHLAGAILSNMLGIGEGFGLIPLFNFDTEQNLPTFFSVLIILASALCVVAHTYYKGANSAAYRWEGFLIGALIFFIALDEFASIHERIGGSLSYYMETDGVFHHAWLVPYLVGVVLFAPIALKWLSSLSWRLRMRICSAGMLYIGGAVGMEMVAGLIETNGALLEQTRYTLLFTAMTLEECLEMSGMGLFLIYMYDALTRSLMISTLRQRLNP